MKSYSEISNRYMKQNKKRTIMTIFGIMMATILIFAVGTFLLSFRDSVIDHERNSGSDYEYRFRSITSEQAGKVINNFEVKNTAVEMIDKNSNIYKINNKDSYLQVGDSNYFKMIYGRKISSGRMPKKYGELVVDDYTKKFLKADIGSSIEAVNAEGKTETFKVVGISNSEYYTGINIATYFDSSELKSDYTYTVSLNLKAPKNKQSIINKIADNAGITINSDNFSGNSTILYLTGNGGNKYRTASIKYIAIFVISIIIVCTVIVIYNSFNMSVIERIRYFGILKAIGATPSQIKKIIFKEGIVMGLIAFPLGCIIGFFALKYGIKLFIKGSLLGMDSFTVGFYKEAVIISAVVVAATIFISMIFPARKAKKISAVEAMKNSNEIKKGKLKRRKNRIIAKVFGIEGDIAYKNIKRTPLRFFITVLALTVSIVIFNVFYGFMDYAKQMTKDQLGEVAYDAVIAPGMSFDDKCIDDFKKNTFLKNMSVFRDGDYAWSIIDKKDLNDNASNVYKFEHDFDDDKADITTRFMIGDNNSLKVTKDYIVEGKFDEEKLNDGEVILVSGQQVRNSNGKLETVLPTKYKAGDKIRVPKVDASSLNENDENYYNEYMELAKKAVKNNQYYEFTIMAIADRNPFSGFSTDNSIQIFMNDKAAKSMKGKMRVCKIGFKFDNDNDREKALEYFNQADNKGQYQYIDQQAMVEEMNDTYSQITFFVYCFIIIVSIISVINIVNTISTNLLLRKKEFSTMKAIGMTGKQLRKSVILEGTIYGIISSVIGGIVSVLLLLFLIRIGGGMGEVTYRFPVIPFAFSILVTILITYAATLAPLKRLKELTIVEGIRDEE